MIPYAPLTREQAEYIVRAQHSWLSVAEGGKRAGKNIINLIAWAAALDVHPDKLHLCGGVSTAAVKMNIIDSNGFGLMHIFAGRSRMGKYRGREALYIRSVKGEKVVIIAGGKKADDAARIKGNSYGSVYVTEVNECHPTFMKECIDRTLASRRRQIFFDLNPKPPSHWFYAEFLDYQDDLKRRGLNPGYNYGHFTILGNLSIGREQLRGELAKYDKGSLWYQSDILGLRTAASGRIYTSYDPGRMVLSPQDIARKRFIAVAVGVDVGGTDATCATLVGITEGWQEVIVLDGMYDRQGISEKMTEARYCRLIADRLSVWARAFPQLSCIYVDAAAKLFRTALREELLRRQLGRIAVKTFNKADGINARIELTCMLQMQGRFFVSKGLARWQEALQMATWDEHAYAQGEWVRLDNGSYPLDCLDSMEYAFCPFARELERSGKAHGS